MERSNYALISALYANKSRGLYSDIYFPIIKYAIVKLYAECTASDCYASSDDVFKKVQELFGIKIPHVVIAMTVKKLDKINDGSIDLQIYEDGNNFRVLSARFDEEEHSYEEREQQFSIHLKEIEFEYKAFIAREDTCDDEATFVDFISSNTESLLGYFENETEEQVEEKYVSMVFFLEYLHRENEALYKVANQLFWSSVITAFLQSERPRVNDEEKGCESEFYLDTSLVLGLLDLSTIENGISAHDVCDIIKSSGGRLKVHPVTLEECKSILSSVALNGAYPGTSIATACSRRNLLAPDITKIQINMQKEVEKLGIQVFPSAMADCRRVAMNKYKGKDVLRQLAEMRSSSADIVYASDNFREVHDVYMDDYIRDQRKDKKDKGNIYFLTTNTDLIDFCKNRHPGYDYMTSTGKVILEMWMHNAKPAEVSSCALTETMARCLDMHRSKVRTKLHEVARYFNKTKEDVAPEVYNEFLRLLYRRARKVVEAVEQIPEEDPKAFMKTLQDAITESNTHFESVNSELNSRNESLNEQVASKQKEVASLSEESEKKSQQIGSLNTQNDTLEQEKSKLESDLKITETALTASQGEVRDEKQKREAAERLNQLYADRDVLKEKLMQYGAMIDPLEIDRKKSFSYKTPVVLLVIGIVLIAVSLVLIILDKTSVITFMSWGGYTAIMTIGGFVLTASFASGSEDRKDKKRNEAYAQWEQTHPKYKELKQQIEETEEDLKLCAREIKNSTPQK